MKRFTADKPVTVRYQSSKTIKPGKYGNVTFVKVYSKYFSDMGNYSWAASAVDGLVNSNVLTGNGKTAFNPGKSNLRADYIVMLYKAAGSPATKVTSTFSDVSTKSSYAKAVSWAVSKGILTKDAKFNPSAALTRQDAFLYAYRSLTSLGVKAKAGSATDLAKYTDSKSLSSGCLYSAFCFRKLRFGK